MVKRVNEISIVPPLKWAGGKRWFAQRYRNLLPLEYERYIEPFFGSGALYFSERPKRALLSDINQELMNLYMVMRDSPDELWAALRRHQRKHCVDYYYRMRSFSPPSALSMAARTLYLNRTCWNGLYRVNLRGEFNVPKGTKDAVILPSDNFRALAEILSGARLAACDFETAIETACKNDFVFIDPPYTVAHNFNGFVKYNQTLFQWADQVRLRDAVKRAVKRGAKVLVTNAAHESVKELYKDFEIVDVERAGVIAGKNSARGAYTEMVARWY
jgi:DNA adenine methylase